MTDHNSLQVEAQSPTQPRAEDVVLQKSDHYSTMVKDTRDRFPSLPPLFVSTLQMQRPTQRAYTTLLTPLNHL